MARYWVRRGVTTLPCPLLSGAAALASTTPWQHAVWVGYFLQAVTIEAAAGIALLRQIERDWLAARRRDSHAAAAIDLLAAAPLLSAIALAQLLGIAIKNAVLTQTGVVIRPVGHLWRCRGIW